MSLHCAPKVHGEQLNLPATALSPLIPLFLAELVLGISLTKTILGSKSPDLNPTVALTKAMCQWTGAALSALWGSASLPKGRGTERSEGAERGLLKLHHHHR